MPAKPEDILFYYHSKDAGEKLFEQMSLPAAERANKFAAGY
jgi:hypothetical protein